MRLLRLVRYGSVIIYRVVSNAALGVIALLTARDLTNSLRGTFLVALAIGGIVAVIATFGLNISARQKLRAYPASECHLGSYLASSIIASLVGACLAPLPLILLRNSTENGFISTLALAAYCGSLTAAFLFVEGVHALERHSLGALLDAIGSVSGLLLMLLYLNSNDDPSLPLLLLTVTGGNVLQIILSTAALSRAPDFMMGNRLEMVKLLTSSRGNHGTVVGVTLLMKSDRYIIAAVLGPAAVSLYATAATVSELIWLPAQGIANYFYKATRASRKLDSVTKWMLVVLTGAGTIIVLLSPQLIGFLFGPRYAPSVHLVPLLMPGSIAMTVYFLDSARLMGLGRGRETSRQLILPILVLLVGTSVIARWYGLNAAAVACSVSYVMLAFMARRAAISTKRHDGSVR